MSKLPDTDVKTNDLSIYQSFEKQLATLTVQDQKLKKQTVGYLTLLGLSQLGAISRRRLEIKFGGNFIQFAEP